MHIIIWAVLGVPWNPSPPCNVIHPGWAVLNLPFPADVCHSTYFFLGSLVELITTFSLCNSSNSLPWCGLTRCGAALISDLAWCTYSLSLLRFTLSGGSSPLHCPPFAIPSQIEPPQVCESLSPLFLSLTARIVMSRFSGITASCY